MKPRNLSIWKPLSLLVLGGAFVSGGSQNPTLSIMSLTIRASEYLAESMKKGEV